LEEVAWFSGNLRKYNSLKPKGTRRKITEKHWEKKRRGSLCHISFHLAKSVLVLAINDDLELTTV